MLVVDASCLYEVISLIRRDAGLSVLAPSRAAIALAEVNDWCGERFPMRLFNDRVWQLRSNVRSWDA